MRKSYFASLKVATVWTVIGLSGLLVAGCSGGADNTAPTNASQSTYNKSGQTAADKIGAARAHARLPKGGADASKGP